MIFRVYGIGRRRADSGRSTLYDLAYRVNSGLDNYDKTIAELKDTISTYESDSQFITDLQETDFYESHQTADIRYFMYQYETHLRKTKKEPLEFTLSEALSRDRNNRPEYEIEHIWSQDTSRLKLDDKGIIYHSENVDKLGNLTLAAKGWNESMGNKHFDEKRSKYGNSLFRVQKELVDYPSWGKTSINNREQVLLNFAATKWKI